MIIYHTPRRHGSQELRLGLSRFNGFQSHQADPVNSGQKVHKIPDGK
jgi:hypothetical protein